MKNKIEELIKIYDWNINVFTNLTKDAKEKSIILNKNLKKIFKNINKFSLSRNKKNHSFIQNYFEIVYENLFRKYLDMPIELFIEEIINTSGANFLKQNLDLVWDLWSKINNLQWLWFYIGYKVDFSENNNGGQTFKEIILECLLRCLLYWEHVFVESEENNDLINKVRELVLFIKDKKLEIIEEKNLKHINKLFEIKVNKKIDEVLKDNKPEELNFFIIRSVIKLYLECLNL